MIPNLFILNSMGEILIEKKYIQDSIKRHACEVFWETLSQEDSNESMLPIFSVGKYYNIYTQRNRQYFLTIVLEEVEPAFILEIHKLIIEIQIFYFTKLTESTIHDNFTLIYQLLDEIIDSGFPVTLEINQLIEMIKPPTISTRVMDALSSSPSSINSAAPIASFNKIPWRKSNNKYTSNKIYFDIIEYLNIIIDKDNKIINSSLIGNIHTKCYLPGIPDITLNFTGLKDVDHCSLHHSVRISRFEKDKVISLIPPDNEFILLSYYKSNIVTKIPIHVNPCFIFDDDTTKFTINVSNVIEQSVVALSITNVTIQITIPKKVIKVNSFSKNGIIKENFINRILCWDIPKISKHSMMVLDGTFIYDRDQFSFEKPVITVQFEAKHYSLSGISIDSLIIQNVDYSPARGVRSTVRANHFQIRT